MQEEDTFATQLRAPRRVLYIMGTGRSGTTMLNILLGSSDSVIATSELCHFIRDGLISGKPCSCGKTASRCTQWHNMCVRMTKNPSQWHKDQTVLKQFERHATFWLTYFALHSRRQITEYQAVNRKMINNLPQAHCVVDASKYAARGLALAKYTGYDVRVVCLTRSAAGLLGSFAKKNDTEQCRKGIVAASLYYCYVLLCVRLACRRMRARVLEITYEELMSNPIATLGKIEAWCSIDLAAAKAKLAGDKAFDVGHIVTGNRLRSAGHVRFQTKTEATKLSVLQRSAAWVLDGYGWILGFGRGSDGGTQ